MAYITLNGDRLILNGPAVVLYANRADGGFYPRRGKGQTYWQKQAEDWIAENIASVEKAAPAQKRAVVAEMLDEAQAVDFAPLPWPVIAALTERMAAPAPDYTAIADALLVELMALKAANRPMRNKRDLEALMVLGW